MRLITRNGFKLAFGQKVTLGILKEKYPVSIRGWKENEYLLLDHPELHGASVKIAPMTGCSVYYTVEGVFYTFKSSILHTVTQPVRLLVIEFPKDYVSHKLRKNSRQRVNFAFSYTRDSGPGDSSYAGTIRDLSLSGALITHSMPLAKGETILANVDLPQGELRQVLARVRNVRKNPKDSKEPFVTGVEFVNLGPEQDKTIRNFVESRVADRRSSNRSNGLK